MTEPGRHDESRVLTASAQRIRTLEGALVQLRDQYREAELTWAAGNLQFAVAMVHTLDARDAYTAGHSAAVATYTAAIAREYGASATDVQRAHLAGLLHDIGKIGVRDEILNKTTPLEHHEIVEVQRHPTIGAEVLSVVDAFSDIAEAVRHHHERIDGTGYPDGLAGDAIPAVSRMIAVADTYSAMTTDRPYRSGMPPERAMTLLEEAASNGQLDIEYTRHFLSILRRFPEAYQRGKLDTFAVAAAQHHTLGLTDIFTSFGTRAPVTQGLDSVVELPVGPNFTLRTFAPIDAHARYELLRTDDGEIAKWLSWAVDPTLERSQSYIEMITRSQAEGRHVHFGIRFGGRLAGEVMVSQLDTDPFVNYYLHHSFRGRGIMTRSILRALDWAFTEFDIKQIQADPNDGHAQSLRVLERCGFAATHIVERYEQLQGEWKDALMHRITADEWFAHKAGELVEEAA